MAKHVHLHLHDSGTSEGAKKAAETRRRHSGGSSEPQTHTIFSSPREARTYHGRFEQKHEQAARNAAKAGNHEEAVAHNKAGAAHMNAARYWSREHGDREEGRRLTAEAERHSRALGVT